MRKKKTALKIKISLHRLYTYYKQLLYLSHFMFQFEKTTYILVNNNNLLNSLETNSIFCEFNLKTQYFKFNHNVYSFLKTKKIFALPSLSNFYFLFNFNYIVQVPENVCIDSIFVDKIISLNTGYTQYLYIKIPNFVNLISLSYYKDFWEMCRLKEVTYKQIRWLIFYKLLFMRCLFYNIHIRNVTYNFPINKKK